jgi:hypothetical protein
MTPAGLQQLLIRYAPGVPGITAAAPRDDENPYRLTVILEGRGRAWWTTTGVSPAGTSPPARLGEDPVPSPDLAGRPVPDAAVAQALIAAARSGGQDSHIDRCSARPRPPAVPYGATITCRDSWKLFLSCYGTTRPGQPYYPAAHLEPTRAVRARACTESGEEAEGGPGMRPLSGDDLLG